ncbi:MAG: glycine cleavage system protein GcvH [Thaumarchaeota archaeon]|nr:glycine cleavage system protein GcvH [Nitrososphaerota archaeon]
MSNTSSYKVPDGLFYTKEHEWTNVTGGTARVGITDYAAKTLNDVVYLTLPSAGQQIKQLGSFGTVESIKAVSELYSPLSGTVIATNPELANHPELVNQSPYESGWIIEVKHTNFEEEKKTLLSPKQYEELLSSIAAEHQD